MRIIASDPADSPFSLAALWFRPEIRVDANDVVDVSGMKITIDGARCEYAVAADTDEGWADVIECAADGMPIYSGEGDDRTHTIKRVYGKVEFHYDGKELT